MNPADQRFEDRIYKRLAAAEKALQDIKTAQPIGADSLQILSTDIDTVTFTLAAGQSGSLLTYWLPSNNQLQLVDFATSLFIDHDLDLAYLWQSGNLLSGDLTKTIKSTTLEWALSSDSDGTKVFQTVVNNNGVSAHTYHFYDRAYYLKGGAA